MVRARTKGLYNTGLLQDVYCKAETGSTAPTTCLCVRQFMYHVTICTLPIKTCVYRALSFSLSFNVFLCFTLPRSLSLTIYIYIYVYMYRYTHLHTPHTNCKTCTHVEFLILPHDSAMKASICEYFRALGQEILPF